MKKSDMKNYIIFSVAIICIGILMGLYFSSKEDKESSKSNPTDTYDEGTIALVEDSLNDEKEEQDKEKISVWKEEANITKTNLTTEPKIDSKHVTEEKDAYPKTVKENDNEVIVDFSDTQTKSEEPKEPPKTTDDITDKSKVPTYSEEQIKPNSSKDSNDKKDTKDTAGNKDSEKSKTQSETKNKTDSSSKDKSKETNNKSDSHEGQVYVPGFGWATPSPVQMEISDNDGSLKKQVGQMK